MQRIKDQCFENVEPKVKPKLTLQGGFKNFAIDQKKCKESLTRTYEKEFMTAVLKLDGDVNKNDIFQPHKIIQKCLISLFAKINALSNYNFTPKSASDLKITTNTSAIEIEEVAPINMSNSSLLAPEEIKRHAIQTMSTAEMIGSDKHGAGRKKKIKLHKQTQDAHFKPSMSDKKQFFSLKKKEFKETIIKNQTIEDKKLSKICNIKTSTVFFKWLNEQERNSKNEEQRSKK